MKVPFFSKSKKSQLEAQGAPPSPRQGPVNVESMSSLSSTSSGSMSFATTSPASSMEKKHKKSSSFSGPLDKLRKSSSFSGLSMPTRQSSGKLFSFKSMRQRSGPQTPVEHCKELTEVFKYFDKNGDGKISATELGQVLRVLGISSTDEELAAMVREVDCDSDGFIDLDEFAKLNKMTQEATCDEESAHKTMEAAFDVFDLNKDGFISATELYRVLSELGEVLTEEDCRTMINNVDKNGDELVDFSEFKNLMQQDTRVY
ncbi:uncharacterized protein [Physcomitrium patens]|uniref:EF-hand domain-containing protein n=1 Tax=Physcomitrium patens TaxID=3218 RepID=A0A2K1KJ83_PHYPA|nr:probable calcium-binding protein CML23 [Physcomitrium patens]PNR53840.1 hypothetical protein PHYPA_007515 [Physcomitrium patens]|eukprot:XP_024375466.1 probable calcium-binding protein CML23 [Physcomitrella patens]